MLLLLLPLSKRSNQVLAASLPIDPTQFTDPNSLLSDSTVKALVKTVGLLSDHRPYEPATGLKIISLGIEATFVKLPLDLKSELESSGLSSTNLPPAVPVPKAHFRIGLGGRADFGVSGIVFKGMRIVGGDFKFVLYEPEEGLTWAMRVAYSVSSLLIVKSQTVSPHLLVSKRLAFAEPYLGIGAQFIKGSVTIPLEELIPSDLPPELAAAASDGEISKDSSGISGFMSFMGLALNFGPVPIRLTMEGGYSSLGGNTLGVKFGVNL